MSDRPTQVPRPAGQASVDLYWLPLGSGRKGGCVRVSGRSYEALAAARHHRAPQRLYHSALVVNLDGAVFTIEMTPVWVATAPDRGVVAEGPVGMAAWGRSRLFRYEIRCWRDGVIPDLASAVDSPRRVSEDAGSARRVVELVAACPVATWGRDEQGAGEMWNSNSLIAWVLARGGHDTAAPEAQPPPHGRAPGWSAGLAVAARSSDHAAQSASGRAPHRG